MPRGSTMLDGCALRCRGVVGTCAALLCGMVLALVVVVAGVQGSAGADEGVDTGNDPGARCEKMPSQVPDLVPKAEVQDPDCLNDLTTKHTQDTGHTNKQDWDWLHAEGTNNPSKKVPGLQIDGYFRTSHTPTRTTAGFTTRSS